MKGYVLFVSKKLRGGKVTVYVPLKFDNMRHFHTKKVITA